MLPLCDGDEPPRQRGGAAAFRQQNPGFDLDTRAAPTAARPRRSILTYAAAALGVLALAVIAVGPLRDRFLGTTPPARIVSLAVLPLENLSGDPEQDYFTDGITEALITDLGKIGSLRVIARSSVMQYKGRSAPLKEVARE